MHTELKLHGVSPEQFFRSYVERRLRFAVSRFGDRIGTVTTRISTPTQGPANDVLCQISADFRPFGTITAEASDPDVFSAIDRCIGKFTRRCESKSARSRSRRPNRFSIRMPENSLAA